MSTPVIEAQSLTKTFGATTALAGVDLTVQRGESVAIMGASGSGKTTLLHVLAAITAPESGSVRFTPAAGAPMVVSVLGERDRSRLRRESFGFVFQQGLLIPRAHRDRERRSRHDDHRRTASRRDRAFGGMDGLALIVQPVSILTIVAVLASGVGIVWASMRITRPLLGRAFAG
ncbi:ATP-binding cassette domain-containing protein [Microbacterium tenebrionis]|uniref:ATP-binding cassette domain-containing protein n=1 Tax=Microbacterium tenebrionis TaxID=2830665 RepID=UPI0034A24DC1